MRLLGKHILVTAAAAGIGRACALAFAKEGAEVHAVDKDEARLTELSMLDGINTYHLDLLSEVEVSLLAKKIEKVDILFNCAGIVHNGKLTDCTIADFDMAYSLNVRAVFILTQLMLQKMLKQGAGNVVNVASVAGVSVAAPNRFAYSATKAAVVGMTKAIACDYVEHGIRCNAICPGTVDTPSLQQRLNEFDDPVLARQKFEARQPMKRFANVEEIAALAVYLASDESGFTTGQTHVIDGGWSNGS